MCLLMSECLAVIIVIVVLCFVFWGAFVPHSGTPFPQKKSNNTAKSTNNNCISQVVLEGFCFCFTLSLAVTFAFSERYCQYLLHFCRRFVP